MTKGNMCEYNHIHNHIPLNTNGIKFLQLKMHNTTLTGNHIRCNGSERNFSGGLAMGMAGLRR